MEEEVEGEGAEVEECGNEAPVLCGEPSAVSPSAQNINGQGDSVYLILDEHGSEAVEELERSDDVALDKKGNGDGSCRPPSGTDRHLVEPLLEWELPDCSSAGATAEHVVHVHYEMWPPWPDLGVEAVSVVSGALR